MLETGLRVTVAKKEAALKKNIIPRVLMLKLVDLPGTYSISPFTGGRSNY